MKNKKKIMHIIVGLGDGGAEKTLFNIISHDALNTHSVVSLTDLGKYGHKLKKMNIEVFVLSFQKNKINFSKIYKLIILISKLKPTLVQSWMYHSDFITLFIKLFFPKLKIFWNIRNTTYPFRDSYSRFLISKICSYLSYFIPEKIISCGYACMNDHIKFGYNKRKWEVVFNGVDTNRFKSENKFKSKIIDSSIIMDHKTPILGVVGRYDKQKGHVILLDALNYLNKRDITFLCIMVGTNINYENKTLIDLIESYELKKNIIMLGQREDIHKIYGLFDLLVLPSINGEGFPNVLIEAMASEVPCLATNVGESKKIVGETGWIIDPCSSKQLSSNLIEIFTKINSKNWINRKKNCRKKIINEFSIEVMINKYNEVWSICDN